LYKTLNSVEARLFNLNFPLFPYFSIFQRTF